MLKKIAPFMILLASAAIAVAQTATSQTASAQPSPDPQQQQEEKAKLEKKAVALLEQVVADAQVLKSHEPSSTAPPPLRATSSCFTRSVLNFCAFAMMRSSASS